MEKKTEYKVKSTFSRTDIGSFEKGDPANLTKEEAKKVYMFLEDYKEIEPESKPTKADSNKKKVIKEGVDDGK